MSSKCNLKIHPLFSFLFIIGIGLLLLGANHPVFGQNKPERLEWFRDLGYGMFIHWSVDSQIGSVISHSLV